MTERGGIPRYPPHIPGIPPVHGETFFPSPGGDEYHSTRPDTPYPTRLHSTYLNNIFHIFHISLRISIAILALGGVSTHQSCSRAFQYNYKAHRAPVWELPSVCRHLQMGGIAAADGSLSLAYCLSHVFLAYCLRALLIKLTSCVHVYVRDNSGILNTKCVGFLQ